MDFAFTEDQKMLQTAIRDFCQKEMAPIVEEWEVKEEFPRELFTKAAPLGYNCIRAPGKYGGAGMNHICEAIVNEEVAKISLGFGESFCLGSNYVAPIIWEYGTKEQCQRYLPPTIRGEWVGAFALTERGGGSDPGTRQTKAVKRGDKWVINGANIFITNGSIFDYALILAVTDPEKGSRGMSNFIIDWGMKGVSRTKLKKMGSLTSDEAEIFLDDVEVPAENMVGEEGRGYRNTLWLIGIGRLPHAARALGMSQAAFDAALTYTKDRVVWGQPIAKHQSLAFRFAEMKTEIEATRNLVYQAAWLADQNDPSFPTFVAIAKLHAAETVMRVARDCLEMFGCYGLMSDSPMQRYYRDAACMVITEATHEILKMVIDRYLGI